MAEFHVFILVCCYHMIPILHQVVSVRLIEILLNKNSQASKALCLIESSDIIGHSRPPLRGMCSHGTNEFSSVLRKGVNGFRVDTD